MQGFERMDRQLTDVVALAGHRTAALNLRNLIGKGLTWRAGGWALAT